MEPLPPWTEVPMANHKQDVSTCAEFFSLITLDQLEKNRKEQDVFFMFMWLLPQPSSVLSSSELHRILQQQSAGLSGSRLLFHFPLYMFIFVY